MVVFEKISIDFVAVFVDNFCSFGNPLERGPYSHVGPNWLESTRSIQLFADRVERLIELSRQDSEFLIELIVGNFDLFSFCNSAEDKVYSCADLGLFTELFTELLW